MVSSRQTYWRTRALTAYRVSQTESFWRHWVALWGKMKRSRAVSFSIFYFLVWQTHDPQLAISPAMALRTRWSPWPFISSLPYFLQQLLAQYLSYFKPWPLNNYCTLCIHCHIDYMGGRGNKKWACSLNCLWPWLCHLAAWWTWWSRPTTHSTQHNRTIINQKHILKPIFDHKCWSKVYRK